MLQQNGLLMPQVRPPPGFPALPTFYATPAMQAAPVVPAVQASTPTQAVPAMQVAPVQASAPPRPARATHACAPPRPVRATSAGAARHDSPLAFRAGWGSPNNPKWRSSEFRLNWQPNDTHYWEQYQPVQRKRGADDEHHDGCKRPSHDLSATLQLPSYAQVPPPAPHTNFHPFAVQQSTMPSAQAMPRDLPAPSALGAPPSGSITARPPARLSTGVPTPPPAPMATAAHPPAPTPVQSRPIAPVHSSLPAPTSVGTAAALNKTPARQQAGTGSSSKQGKILFNFVFSLK